MKIIKTVRRSGFTLIEMIGVLAVIAILAALLIPKIFEAINNARVNNACISLDTVKTALADHYAKYGALASDSGTPISITAGTPSTGFDKVLLKEAFIDKPFAVKISSSANTTVQLVQGVASTTTVTGANEAYNLDSDSSATPANDAGPATSVVVEALIVGVTAQDALELSKRLDGDAASVLSSGADLLGRVKYAAPSGGLTDVHVYLTHR